MPLPLYDFLTFHLFVGSPTIGEPELVERRAVAPLGFGYDHPAPRVGDEEIGIVSPMSDLRRDDGTLVQRSIMSNYNDHLMLEMEGGYLTGRTDQGRGPVQNISPQWPLKFDNKKLYLDAEWTQAPLVTLDDTSGTINWRLTDAVVQMAQVTLTGSPRTFSIAHRRAGVALPRCHLTLWITQGAGNQLINWPANVKWPGGVPPALSTAAGAVDLISLVSNGAAIYGTYMNTMG